METNELIGGSVELLVSNAVAIFASVMASSGFWAYFKSKENRKDANTVLLLGLAHDRIVHLGMGYINRGYISKDEYEDFMKYLYGPYSTFGGNGLAERIAASVSELPFRSVNSNAANNVPRGRVR